jgi:hypothetical protein
MIVIYQMAKVASMAWTEAARNAPLGSPHEPVHIHYLTARNFRALEDILTSPRGWNGIANPLVATHILRKGKQMAPVIEAARAQGGAMRLVTGMRDPVARSLSLLAFFADFCGRAGDRLSARDGADADDVCAYLEQLWRSVISGKRPDGGFDQLLWHMTASYRTWFGDELETVFGIDIMSMPFPSGGGAQRMRHGHVDLLAYRVEDMHPDAAAHGALAEAATEFLEVSKFALPAVNTASTRRSYPLYAQVAAQFALPAALLDSIYDVPCVKHFYTAAEIAGFRRQWGGGS